MHDKSFPYQCFLFTDSNDESFGHAQLQVQTERYIKSVQRLDFSALITFNCPHFLMLLCTLWVGSGNREK